MPVGGGSQLMPDLQKGGVEGLQGGVPVPLHQCSQICLKGTYTVSGPEVGLLELGCGVGVV